MTRISCLCAAALSRVFFCSSSSSRVDIHPPHYYYINIVRRIVTVGTHIVCHLVYTPLGVLRVEQKAGIHPSSGCIVLRQKTGPAHTSGSLGISCDARLFFSFFFFFSLKWILFSLLHLSLAIYFLCLSIFLYIFISRFSTYLLYLFCWMLQKAFSESYFHINSTHTFFPLPLCLLY